MYLTTLYAITCLLYCLLQYTCGVKHQARYTRYHMDPVSFM